MSKSDALLGSNIPFVQAHHTGPKQRPTAIVIRTSFTTSDAGAALGIAYAWHDPTNRVDSCHYVIDEMQAFRCVPDRLASRSLYTLRFNKRAIVINVCHNPPVAPVDRVTHLAAKQVARLCRLHKIRPRLLDGDDQLRWIEHPWKHRGGIILATAGPFPTIEFFDLVKHYYTKIY